MSEQAVDGDKPTWPSCYTCREYAVSRRDVLAQPLADKAIREGRDVVSVVGEFMLAAHEVHMASGGPLRPGGPTTIANPSFGRLAALLAPGLFEGELDPATPPESRAT